MKKNEIFSQIMGLVSSKTDISEEQMLSMCRKEDVLDARALVVYFCRKCGLNNDYIRLRFCRKDRHFTQNMYGICESRKRFNRYYGAIFAAISEQLCVNVALTDC